MCTTNVRTTSCSYIFLRMPSGSIAEHVVYNIFLGETCPKAPQQQHASHTDHSFLICLTKYAVQLNLFHHTCTMTTQALIRGSGPAMVLVMLFYQLFSTETQFLRCALKCEKFNCHSFLINQYYEVLTYLMIMSISSSAINLKS